MRSTRRRVGNRLTIKGDLGEAGTGTVRRLGAAFLLVFFARIISRAPLDSAMGSGSKSGVIITFGLPYAVFELLMGP